MDSENKDTHSLMEDQNRSSSESTHIGSPFSDDPASRLMEYKKRKDEFDTLENKSRRRNRACLYVALHGGIICIYFVIFLATWQVLQERYKHGPNLYYTPARNAIQYELQRFNITDVTVFPLKYLGKPSEAIEEAWEDLLKPSNTWFYPEEIKKMGGVHGDPVIMPNGTVLGSLNVYHQLHCVKRLYRILFPEHFYPNITDLEHERLIGHSMHCLDFIRQSVMCSADISPMVLTWASFQAAPTADLQYNHECANWDAFEDWTRSRQVDPFTPGLITHPKLGPAFANLDPHKIGAILDQPHDGEVGH